MNLDDLPGTSVRFALFDAHRRVAGEQPRLFSGTPFFPGFVVPVRRGDVRTPPDIPTSKLISFPWLCGLRVPYPRLTAVQFQFAGTDVVDPSSSHYSNRYHKQPPMRALLTTADDVSSYIIVLAHCKTVG